MKFLQSIRQKTVRLSKKSLLLGFIAFASTAFMLGAAQAGFAPDRPTYDYNKPCDPQDNDPYDRCGSLNGPVFNSFINTPSYGDERAFVDAKRTDQTAAGSFKDVLPEVSGGSKEVVIRAYIHNNANPATNADGTGVAKNTKIRFALPTGTDTHMQARGFISADNATMVEDSVDFTDTANFSVEYVPGSAIMYNNGAFKDGAKLDDSIVSTGALVGDQAINGDVPGCFEHEIVVEIHVKIVPKDVKITFSKMVKDDKTGSEWGETATVQEGEKTNWLIGFANDGSQDMTHVSISDKLPPHVSVVPGSVRYIDATQDTVLPNDQFFTTGGYDFGTWSKNGGFYVRFQTTALADFDACEVTVRNVSRYTTAESQNGEDVADVTIKKKNCNQPQTPSVVCNSLDVASITLKKGAHTTLTAKSTATNATVNGYIFKVNGAVVKESNSAADNTYDFSQSSTGTYQASVDVKSSLGNVTSDACKKSITVTEETPAPSYTCESFTLSRNTVKVNEKFTATAKVTAQNGAVFKLATFTFGDEGSNNKFVTNKIADGVVSAEHAYTVEGNYVPRVKLEFTVNGETKVVEDTKCVAQIKVEKQVLGTTTPTTLPVTGADDIAGIFSAVTIVGAVAHRRSTLKKRRS